MIRKSIAGAVVMMALVASVAGGAMAMTQPQAAHAAATTSVPRRGPIYQPDPGGGGCTGSGCSVGRMAAQRLLAGGSKYQPDPGPCEGSTCNVGRLSLRLSPAVG